MRKFPRKSRPAANLAHTCEPLEPRALFYAWTAQEVYLSELINRARADPLTEGVRLGLNLGTGLTLGEQALLTPKQPLALSAALTAAARAHALDMGARNFFDHTNPDNLDPTDRAQNAGYIGTSGENIGAGYDTIDALYRSWMTVADERRNVLSLNTSFDSTYHYDHLGPGFALNVTGAAYSSYFAAEFGNPTSHSTTLLGVVFTDSDADQFYSIGEGLGEVRVDAFTGSTTTGAPAGTYTTDAAGNYQIPLAPGSYTLVFTRLGDNYRVVKTATIAAGQNLEVRAKASEFTQPPPPPDDHANAGLWSSASTIDINSTTGSGSRTGTLGVSGDTDLFSFVAARTGPTQLTCIPVASAFTARIRIYNDSGSLIATNSTATVQLTAGRTYFILIDASNTNSTGNYSVTVQGPPDNPDQPTIPPEDLGADAQGVSPTLLGGKPVLAFINQSGQPIIAMRNALGAWTSTDIQAATGSPAVSGDLSTWVDPRDGFLYAAARSDAGVLVYKRDNAGTWTVRNLTAEIAVSRPIVSNLTTFTDSAGLRQIAGFDAQGKLVTYWMTGLLWPVGWRYFFTDVAGRDLVRRNHPMPAVTGSVASYVTQKNSLNVISTTAGGSVILFFRPGGGLATQLWNWANLTAITGCAPLVGNITATETSGRIVNISGVDASGNLWMITWRFGEGWRSRNVTAAAGGAALTPASVTSWVNGNGAGFAAGLTSDGAIVLYRYTLTGATNTWSFATISNSVPIAPALVGSLRATITSAGMILITGLTVDDQAIRFTFTPGATGSWTVESVSELLAI